MRYLKLFAFSAIVMALSLLFSFHYCSNAFAFDLFAYIPNKHIKLTIDDSERALDIRKAMVKIYADNNSTDYCEKSKQLSRKKINGSGCIIQGNMILTNAHVVANQPSIKIRRFGRSKKKMRILCTFRMNLTLPF